MRVSLARKLRRSPKYKPTVSLYLRPKRIFHGPIETVMLGAVTPRLANFRWSLDKLPFGVAVKVMAPLVELATSPAPLRI